MLGSIRRARSRTPPCSARPTCGVRAGRARARSDPIAQQPQHGHPGHDVALVADHRPDLAALHAGCVSACLRDNPSTALGNGRDHGLWGRNPAAALVCQPRQSPTPESTQPHVNVRHILTRPRHTSSNVPNNLPIATTRNQSHSDRRSRPTTTSPEYPRWASLAQTSSDTTSFDGERWDSTSFPTFARSARGPNFSTAVWQPRR